MGVYETVRDGLSRITRSVIDDHIKGLFVFFLGAAIKRLIGGFGTNNARHIPSEAMAELAERESRIKWMTGLLSILLVVQIYIKIDEVDGFAESESNVLALPSSMSSTPPAVAGVTSTSIGVPFAGHSAADSLAEVGSGIFKWSTENRLRAAFIVAAIVALDFTNVLTLLDRLDILWYAIALPASSVMRAAGVFGRNAWPFVVELGRRCRYMLRFLSKMKTNCFFGR